MNSDVERIDLCVIVFAVLCGVSVSCVESREKRWAESKRDLLGIVRR
jgi:hypothetical protein